ncbi:MAG: hypothetical protein AB8G86_12710 [Saprospiraceae bacterium]
MLYILSFLIIILFANFILFSILEQKEVNSNTSEIGEFDYSQQANMSTEIKVAENNDYFENIIFSNALIGAKFY